LFLRGGSTDVTFEHLRNHDNIKVLLVYVSFMYQLGFLRYPDIIEFTPILGSRRWPIVILLKLYSHIRKVRNAGSGLGLVGHNIQIKRLIRKISR